MNAPFLNVEGATPIGVDPRLTFLQRAAARCVLVECEKVTLDDAFDGLAPDFLSIIGWPVCELCGCQPCETPTFCKLALEDERKRRAMPPPPPRPPPTPQTTVEAIMYCARERGIAALTEPSNIDRLSHCDSHAKAEINRRIAVLVTRRDRA
jgi:hypothetical protein